MSHDPKYGMDRSFDLIWNQVATPLAERGFDRTAKSCCTIWMSVSKFDDSEGEDSDEYSDLLEFDLPDFDLSQNDVHI